MDWAFRYDGAPGGLKVAMDAHAKKNPTRAVPEIVATLLEKELANAATRSTRLIVAARGNEPETDKSAEGSGPQRTVRALHIDVSFIG
jgi:hypothetical protein